MWLLSSALRGASGLRLALGMLVESAVEVDPTSLEEEVTEMAPHRLPEPGARSETEPRKG
jgi:hypothetical protein